MYRGMYHGRPVVNGYSGFFPPGYDVLRLGFALHDPRMFDALTALGPVLVVVDTAHDPEGQWVKQVTARPGATLERVEAGRKVFSLAGGSLPEEVAFPAPLPIQSVTANINADRMPLVLDGNLETCWDSGAQLGAEIVTIDLGSTRAVDGVDDDARIAPARFPADPGHRELRGRPHVDGAGGREARRPSLSPRPCVTRKRCRCSSSCRSVPARMLRLRQVGHDPNFHWLIFELAVHGR